MLRDQAQSELRKCPSIISLKESLQNLAACGSGKFCRINQSSTSFSFDLRRSRATVGHILPEFDRSDMLIGNLTPLVDKLML